MSRIDWRDDRGFGGGTEAVPFGVLVFVMGTLLLVNLWAVIDTKMALNAAAREHVHAMAEATNPSTAEADGRTAAQGVIQAWGRDPNALAVEPIEYPDGSWKRCGRIEVTLRYDLPLINIPLIGATWGPTPFAVRATRTERVDPFRTSAEVIGECV
jgi:Flp pilus assembly protein TadG